MTDVVIAGIGQIPVGEHWELSLRTMAARAVQAALKDAGTLQPKALYIGNALASSISHQANLGALLAEDIGLNGIEAYTVEAAEASSAGAFRLAYLALTSGYVDCALVLGVEKVTDMVGSGLESAFSETTDFDYEAVSGTTINAQAALLMQRYLHEYNAPHKAFADFAMLAQSNASGNPNAYFRKGLTREAYDSAEPVCDPLTMFDIAPIADGAAALLLTRSDLLPNGFPHPFIKVTGSSVCTDALSLHDRPDPLAFDAARKSIQDACRMAGILPKDADFFELTDSYSVYAALSLEAAGFASRGSGWKLAQEGKCSLSGSLPISTLGGCKGRGNPFGATGAYQILEAVLQLRGDAGTNQVKKHRRALVQSLGGQAATAITHILEISGVKPSTPKRSPN